MRPLRFALAEIRALQPLAERLAAALGCVPEHGGRVRRSYLDTFDWRLYAAGWVLEAEQAAGGVRLALRRAGDLEPRFVQHRGAVPRFADDLPDSPLGARVAALIEMRALLPQVTVTGQEQRLTLRDAEGKARLRMVLGTRSVARPGGGTAGRRRADLVVEPVRGYAAAFRRARELAARQPELCPLAGEPLVEALAALGREPLDYSSKLRFRLDPKARADASMKRMLAHLLDTMEVNEAGVREDLDSEFLHDFRVAVRRTRALLGQMKDVLPARRIARFRVDFAWLGASTGALRDLHVYLLHIPDYEAALPAAARGALGPFRAFLERHRATEHAALAALLGGTRYRRLKADWRRFLAAPVPRRASTLHGARPVVEPASARIWKAFRRVRREGRAIDADSPPEALHELRKSCKKLRYLLEFFADLYPHDAAAGLVKALKGLQDNLGTYQDLHVQQGALGRFGRLMGEEGALPEATARAMEQLIIELAQREGSVRGEFARRFARFDTRATRQRFRALCGRDGAAEDTPP